MSVNLTSLSSAPATTGKKGVIWARAHCASESSFGHIPG